MNTTIVKRCRVGNAYTTYSVERGPFWDPEFFSLKVTHNGGPMDTITQTRTVAPVVNDDVPTVAFTCPSCDGHNVTDAGLGACGDCGLTDNLSAFTGGGMTAKARFKPSRYAQSGGRARSFDAPRAFTISGNID